MTKRRLDEGGFANVLRQKHRVDPILKQEAGTRDLFVANNLILTNT